FAIFNKAQLKVSAEEVRLEYNLIRHYLGSNHSMTDIVALSLGHDYRYLLALLACQDLGLCYIPMKPNWPEGRVNQIKEMTGLKTIVTDELLGQLLAQANEETKILPMIEFEVSGDSPLYIMFTSGSTGEPK